MYVKICGITCVEDADLCLAAGVSALGFNLVPSSPRAVSREMACTLTRHVAGRCRTLLLVADWEVEAVRTLLRETGADGVQLVGHESHETVRALLPHAIKALRIGDAADVEAARTCPGEVILVDAKVPGLLGGTGRSVDVGLVGPLSEQRKMILAGGLTPANVEAAIRAVRPYGVDVAGGVERAGEPRRKDPDKVRAFVLCSRRAGAQYCLGMSTPACGQTGG